MHRKKIRLATRERGIRRQNKAIIILILRCMLLVVDMRERERENVRMLDGKACVR